MLNPETIILLVLALSAQAMVCLWIVSRERGGRWLASAITSMGDAVLTTDKHGRVLWLNKVAEKLTGWPLKEAKGKHYTDILRLVDHDTRTPIKIPAANELVHPAAKLDKNVILIARDSSERPVDNGAAPITGFKGRIKGIIFIIRDITERYIAEQKLLESEERLKAVTGEVRIGLVMINRDRRYVYANNFYLQMLGISGVNIIGKHVTDVLPADVLEQVSPNLDRAFAGERLSYEVKGVYKNERGSKRLYSVTYEPQKRQSMVTNVIIVIRNITHLKRMEASSPHECGSGLS